MSATPTPAIEVKNLVKEFQVYQKKPGLSGSIQSLFSRKYETTRAVDNVSCSIEPGEIVGFIGQNGAGKTTTLKMLAGLLYPTSGVIRVLGFDPWKRQPAFQKQFALIMGQKNQLWWDLPAMETFLLNQAIYEIPDTQFRATLEKLTELLDIKDSLNVQVRKLSLGQRMKCELIAALLHNPKVLFLDEPTIGLDVVMQKTLRDFIRSYNQEFKATIILTTHYMGDVKELCKRAIMIDHGKIFYDGELKGLIDRYARNKHLKLVFTQSLTKKALESFGIVKEYLQDGSDITATLEVPRSKVALVASRALAELPVTDLTIEEPSIEAIIREIFQTKDKSKMQTDVA